MESSTRKDLDDFFRFGSSESLARGVETQYRSEYDRDYARILHSPSFRRLQNKTQLFPGQESDFFRNRLTHSLEVSQIAHSIACKLKMECPELNVLPEVCTIAGLAHDIGHPPFGHNGERALDREMKSYGGFEGNAQTFRILTRLEKKEPSGRDLIFSTDGRECRVGLNLSARVLASTLKYDHQIKSDRRGDDSLEKGYYASEAPLVDTLKEKLCLPRGQKFKTIECGIMDLADDIAYSTYDVEDAFKAGFLTPYEMMSADDDIYEQVASKLKFDGIDITHDQCRLTVVNLFESVWSQFVEMQKKTYPDKEDFDIKTVNNALTLYRRSSEIASDGYMRTSFTSALANYFINGVHLKINKDNSAFSQVYFDDDTLRQVNILKHFSYVALISSPRLKVSENRGGEIIERIFKRLDSSGGDVLLPDDMRYIYRQKDTVEWHKRVICDFIAGMTDRYAIEFYGRLFSENPQTIFKPLY